MTIGIKYRKILMFCGCDGIGRHARFRFLCASVWVRVPSSAYIRSSPAQLRAGLFSYMRRGSPRTHGFSVSSAQSAFVGRFGGKMVHRTIFCFRLTLHPQDAPNPRLLSLAGVNARSVKFCKSVPKIRHELLLRHSYLFILTLIFSCFHSICA